MTTTTAPRTTLPPLPAAAGGGGRKGRDAGGGLALAGRRFHYFGGLVDRDTDSADHWVLDLDATGNAAKWKSAAAMPAPRNQFGIVTHQGKIYAIGGQFHHDSRSGKPALDQKRVDIKSAENSYTKKDSEYEEEQDKLQIKNYKT